MSPNNRKILFIHHSTGGNLIREGNVRDEIKRLDSTIEFWDHSYNLSPIFPSLLARYTHLRGLTDQYGNFTGKDYNIVLSNNSPKEYADIFSRDPSDETLHSILSYDVIIFKNCFPTTKITSDQQLEEDKKYYTMIRYSLKKYPEKKFILLTPPPLRCEMTTLENAKRAQELARWLGSDEFLYGVSNVYVFDFFGLLADEQGFLRKDYSRLLPLDSHPNRKANEAIGPVFARYLVELANL